MEHIIFILASVFIGCLLYTVIKHTDGDIKVLRTGSTLEKMQVLNISVQMTMMRKAFEQKVKAHKQICYVTRGLGYVILLFVIGIVILRLLELRIGV